MLYDEVTEIFEKSMKGRTQMYQLLDLKDMNLENCSKEIMEIAYKSYMKEMEKHSGVLLKPYEEYQVFLKQELNNTNGFVCMEDEICLGYLLYNKWEENEEIHCSIPEWGYGATKEKREKIISRLFQALADELVGEKTVHFSMNVYAHDTKIQRLFSFLEFGTQAEVGICKIEDIGVEKTVRVRKISKDELADRWDEVWSLLEQLINHLKKSPVFYGGEEFTEEVYREFFADAGTRVYIAEKDGKVIGLIEANVDTISQVFSDGEAANVGEVYVLPEYRGTVVGQELLSYACKDLAKDGYWYAWVEHGTANPNARYFWNKHFATYRYEMIRTVYGRALDKEDK